MAVNNSLRIKVGASLDSNIKTVYKPLVDAARDAAKAIKKEFEDNSAKVTVTFKQSAANSNKAIATVAQASKKMALDTSGSLDQVRQRFEGLQEAARKGLDLKSVASEAERELKRIERAAAKASIGLSGHCGGLDGAGPPGAFARRTGYMSQRYFDGALRSGARFAGDVARGAGFDFNLGSAVSNVVSQQSTARDISNAAYFEDANGKSTNGPRVDPNAIRGDAKAAADMAGLDRSSALGGLQSFVGKTGDLQTGRDILKQMAVLSKATATELDDMVSAAGDVDLALGDMPNKGQEVYAVMRAIAGQGKTGAVEIRDLANNMAKISSQASKFKLDASTAGTFAQSGITSEVGQNIAVMGVMAQAARQHGGARSAGVATQASMAFIRDLTSHAEMTRLGAAGVDVFADKAHTQTKDPKALILEILRASQGRADKISAFMPNQNSRSVVNAFTQAYNGAGGGQKGLAAAAKQWDDLAKSTMGEKEVQESFSLAVKETSSQMQILRNQLEDVAEKISGAMLPALMANKDKILEVTQAFGQLVTWAAENPMTAVATALAASVARAGLENVLRSGVENALTGMQAGKGAGALGNLAAGLTIAAAAFTTVQIGEAFIDNWFMKQQADQKKYVEEGIGIGNHLRAVDHTHTATAEQKADLESDLAKAQARQEASKKALEDQKGGGSLIDKLVSPFDSGESHMRNFANAQKHYDEDTATLKEIAEHLAAIKDGGIPTVETVKPPKPGKASRSGPEGETD